MVFLKYTVFALARDIVYAPVWWYTRGAFFISKWLVRTSVSTWNQVGLAVWIKNIFVPMFQQYDWQGRIISFFMRLAQIIGRFVGFVVMFVIFMIVYMAWFVLPVLAIWLGVGALLIGYTPIL